MTDQPPAAAHPLLDHEWKDHPMSHTAGIATPQDQPAPATYRVLAPISGVVLDATRPRQVEVKRGSPFTIKGDSPLTSEQHGLFLTTIRVGGDLVEVYTDDLMAMTTAPLDGLPGHQLHRIHAEA